jgi:hypothetical protein
VDILLEQDLRSIEENWMFLPFSLTYVDTIANQKLYSSKKLQEQTIELFSQQKIFSPVIDKINNLIDRQIIVPCIATKSLIVLLKNRIFSKNKTNLIDQLTVGYYSSSKNKVFVIIDGKSVSTFNNLVTSSVSKITMHELQHYCAYNLQTKFLSLNKQSLINFYTEFFKTIFGTILPVKDISKIIEYIFTNYELSNLVNINFLNKYASILDTILRTHIYSNYEREHKIVDIMSVLKVYLQDGSSFINLLKQKDENSITIYTKLIDSYDKINVSHPSTIAIQELVYPSEVIAIESEYNPSSNHYKSIQLI